MTIAKGLADGGGDPYYELFCYGLSELCLQFSFVMLASVLLQKKLLY